MSLRLSLKSNPLWVTLNLLHVFMHDFNILLFVILLVYQIQLFYISCYLQFM